MKNTTIQVDEEVWMELNHRKNIGEDFNDVLRILLKLKPKEEVKKKK